MANNLRDGLEVHAATAEVQRAVDAVVRLIFSDFDDDVVASVGHYDAIFVPNENGTVAIKVYGVMLHLQQGPDFCQVHTLGEKFFMVYMHEVGTQGYSVVQRAEKVEFYINDDGHDEMRVFCLDGLGEVTEIL